MADFTAPLDAELDRLGVAQTATDAAVVDVKTTADSAVASASSAQAAIDTLTGIVNTLSAGQAALAARVAVLEGPKPVVPTAAFTLDKVTGVAPLHVVMNQTCANADHFQMDWGGGLPTPVGTIHALTENAIGHDYPNAGSYPLSLHAWRDSDGAEAFSAGMVTVTAPPTTGTVGKSYGGISLPLAQNPATDISRIAADGFGWYRFDVPIKTISQTKGTFNWSAYDPTFQAAAAAGLKVNAIIYMLPQWMNGNSDDKYAPTNVQDYADWCGAAAPHLYAVGVRSMELWNEQNHVGFWKPAPDRVKYVDMAIRAADAIHAAEPRMIVVSGGVSTADEQTSQTQGGYTSPWPGCHRTLDIYGSLGLYAHVDAVGIHPYLDDTDPTPTGGSNWCEWAGGAVRTTIGIIDKWAPEGKKLTVWNTESACPLTRYDGSTITQTEKANRAAHAFQAFNSWKLADGSPMRPRLGPFFWFTYRYWTGQNPREATFGLVDANYVSQPVRAAVMTELAAAVAP